MSSTFYISANDANATVDNGVYFCQVNLIVNTTEESHEFSKRSTTSSVVLKGK